MDLIVCDPLLKVRLRGSWLVALGLLIPVGNVVAVNNRNFNHDFRWSPLSGRGSRRAILVGSERHVVSLRPSRVNDRDVALVSIGRERPVFGGLRFTPIPFNLDLYRLACCEMMLLNHLRSVRECPPLVVPGSFDVVLRRWFYGSPGIRVLFALLL